MKQPDTQENNPKRPPALAEAHGSAKRGLVCCFCGEGWGYEGDKPTEALLKDAVDHEAKCPRNPYLAEIRKLRGIIARNALQRLDPDNWHITAQDIKDSLDVLYAEQDAGRIGKPNDPSSATRRTRAHDCKPRRPAGFAAAHG